MSKRRRCKWRHPRSTNQVRRRRWRHKVIAPPPPPWHLMPKEEVTGVIFRTVSLFLVPFHLFSHDILFYRGRIIEIVIFQSIISSIVIHTNVFWTWVIEKKSIWYLKFANSCIIDCFIIVIIIGYRYLILSISQHIRSII